MDNYSESEKSVTYDDLTRHVQDIIDVDRYAFALSWEADNDAHKNVAPFNDPKYLEGYQDAISTIKSKIEEGIAESQTFRASNGVIIRPDFAPGPKVDERTGLHHN